MQIVITWVAGSPLLAVLIGKMIAFGDRQQVAQSRAPISAAPLASRFEPTPLLGATETAA